MRNPNRVPVSLRAAREISPGSCRALPRTARLHDFPPPSALRPPPFFAVHQSINAFQPNNLPGFSKLFQSPRPSQPGQTRSASRSAVTVSELNPASDAAEEQQLEGYPGKRRAISVGVHYHSPRWFHVRGREKMGLSHAHVHLDSLRAAWPSGPQWMARWSNKHRDQRPDHSEAAIPTFHQPALWPPFAAL